MTRERSWDSEDHAQRAARVVALAAAAHELDAIIDRLTTLGLTLAAARVSHGLDAVLEAQNSLPKGQVPPETNLPPQ